MIFLLDTSVVIALLRHTDTAVEFLSTHIEDEIITSSICKAEVFTGVYHSKNSSEREKEARELLNEFYKTISFDAEQAEIAGKLKSGLMKKGSIIEDADIFIAAAALSVNATLVTYNSKHFQRIKELKVHSLL